jgi:hypothetical protein
MTVGTNKSNAYVNDYATHCRFVFWESVCYIARVLLLRQRANMSQIVKNPANSMWT